MISSDLKSELILHQQSMDLKNSKSFAADFLQVENLLHFSIFSVSPVMNVL